MAFAVRMKSLLRTASMDARVIRASGASTNSAMVQAGSSNCENAAHQPLQSPTIAKSTR